MVILCSYGTPFFLNLFDHEPLNSVGLTPESHMNATDPASTSKSRQEQPVWEVRLCFSHAVWTV